MIAFLGDIHGVSRSLEIAAARAYANGASALIQVGDFGVYPGLLGRLIGAARRSPIPIYFIDGNHEDFRMIRAWWDAMEADDVSVYHVVKDQLRYVRRGSVLTVDGRQVAFLGGAGSIDYAYRKLGTDWFNEEQIADADVLRLELQALGNINLQALGKKVDLMVAHTPPRWFIDKHFDVTPARAAFVRRQFGVAPDWTDPSADKVQAAWESLGKPLLFCGHMHATIQDGNVRLLDCDGLAYA